MVSYHRAMNENEKPLSEPSIWTPGNIALLALNILFLGIIMAGIIVLYQVFSPPLQAWLTHRFGL